MSPTQEHGTQPDQNVVPVFLRMSPRIKHALKRAADREDRSVNSLATRALEHFLEEEYPETLSEESRN